MILTFADSVTFVRLVQSLNAPIPILVTLFGMVMEVRPVQPLKAESPILLTLLGIDTVFFPAGH